MSCLRRLESPSHTPLVSIVTAARNAAGTLPETLESVRAQTFADWELVVVDDGSTDETPALVEAAAAQDARIRLVQEEPKGTGAARNAGVELARGEWLLFLDADDLILPSALEELLVATNEDPEAAVAFCGFARVDATGRSRISEWRPTVSGDLFEEFAKRCVFACHCALVRRSVVLALGGFDVESAPCEDWDLWQRIARTGARFRAVNSILALYRTLPGSRSMAPAALAADAIRIIERGHAADSRVATPAPEHVDGAPRERLSRRRAEFVLWTAALAVAKGEEPTWLADVRDDLAGVLSPELLADHLYWTVPLAASCPVHAWPELWDRHQQRIDAFLRKLEADSHASALQARTKRILARRVVESSDGRLPPSLGRASVEELEIFGPIHGLELDGDVVFVRLLLDGEALGLVELPVCDGVVPAYVLADAVVERHSWAILGRFFEATVPGYEPTRHDEIGWTAFLQELWGRPGAPDDEFYDLGAGRDRERDHTEPQSEASLTLEVSHTFTDVEVAESTLTVKPTVGGVAIGLFDVRGGRVVTAQELRAATTVASGFELCRAAVREAVVGRPPAERLRERLAAAASARVGRDPALAAVAPRSQAIVLARRAPGVFGGSGSRRAALPAAAAEVLRESAELHGESVVRIGSGSAAPAGIVYAPDVGGSRTNAPDATPAEPSAAVVRPFGRAHFESVFASRRDPWGYEHPYEQVKYEQTLSLVPDGVRRALEVGCAEGHFTVRLAPLVASLVAADISRVALARAGRNCSALSNVSFLWLDLTKDPLPQDLDLIVCSELLYYVGELEDLESVGRKLADALVPGGHLLTAHAHLVSDDPDLPGFNWGHPFGARVIGETLESTNALRLVEEIRTPLYRVQSFRRPTRTWRPQLRPVITEVTQPTPLPPDLERSVRRPGGNTAIYMPGHEEVVTRTLPILMYHRVARGVEGPLARYAVSPEAFEEQLAYLRDAGYGSVGLEAWRQAAESKRPLPGRGVALTFDDGYLDFRTEAWPLLEQYGFTAIVFLVADLIGQTNRWDAGAGTDVPLLGWDDVLRLQADGVEFGSHTASHRSLTGLTNDEIAREAARSRSALRVGLGRPAPAFAYPYGDVDPAVAHLVGACGYSFGLTCETRRATFEDSLLMLPRIEVAGTDTLEDFVLKLGLE